MPLGPVSPAPATPATSGAELGSRLRSTGARAPWPGLPAAGRGRRNFDREPPSGPATGCSALAGTRSGSGGFQAQSNARLLPALPKTWLSRTPVHRHAQLRATERSSARQGADIILARCARGAPAPGGMRRRCLHHLSGRQPRLQRVLVVGYRSCWLSPVVQTCRTWPPGPSATLVGA